MSNTDKKTPKTALERINNLEDKMDRLMMVVSQGFGSVESRIGQLSELLTATVMVVGKDEVMAKIEEIRKARREAEIAKEKATLAKAVELGIVTQATQIAEESLIVGSEFAADGVTGNPYVQFTYSSLLPEFQQQLLLKGAGEKIETPAKGTFTVLEIYQPAPGIDLDSASLTDLVAQKEAEKAKAEAPTAEAPQTFCEGCGPDGDCQNCTKASEG